MKCSYRFLQDWGLVLRHPNVLLVLAILTCSSSAWVSQGAHLGTAVGL